MPADFISSTFVLSGAKMHKKHEWTSTQWSFVFIMRNLKCANSMNQPRYNFFNSPHAVNLKVFILGRIIFR